MNNKIILLLLFCCLLSSCEKYSPTPCTSEYTYKKIRQPVMDYFPYKPGQQIKFKQYVDSIFIKEITYKCDTQRLDSVFKTIYNSNPDGCDDYETIDIMSLRLYNTTELNNDCEIKITGGYIRKDYYMNDGDPSDLKIIINQTYFGFASFGSAVTNGYRYADVKSIILNGKDYGSGFCVWPDSWKKIYFNSKYGIIKMTNDSTHERLEYSE